MYSCTSASLNTTTNQLIAITAFDRHFKSSSVSLLFATFRKKNPRTLTLDTASVDRQKSVVISVVSGMFSEMAAGTEKGKFGFGSQNWDGSRSLF